MYIKWAPIYPGRTNPNQLQKWKHRTDAVATKAIALRQRSASAAKAPVHIFIQSLENVVAL